MSPVIIAPIVATLLFIEAAMPISSDVMPKCSRKSGMAGPRSEHDMPYNTLIV